MPYSGAKAMYNYKQETKPQVGPNLKVGYLSACVIELIMILVIGGLFYLAYRMIF